MEVLTKVKPRYGITHPGKCHPDESLCGAIIHLLFGDIPIHRRQPTDAELDDPTVFVFDTGGSFNPKKNNFDHHQNKALPAACLLMWDKLVSDKGPENKALKESIRKTIIKPISDSDTNGSKNPSSEELSLGKAIGYFIKSFSDYDIAYEETVVFFEKLLRGKIKTFLSFYQSEREWAGLSLYGDNKIKFINKTIDFVPPEWADLAKKDGIRFLLVKEISRRKLPMLFSLNGIIPRDRRQAQRSDDGLSSSYHTLDGARNHALELVIGHK